MLVVLLGMNIKCVLKRQRSWIIRQDAEKKVSRRCLAIWRKPAAGKGVIIMGNILDLDPVNLADHTMGSENIPLDTGPQTHKKQNKH